MARLPLCRTRAKGHRLQCELRQVERHLQQIVVIKEPQITYGSCSQIMSYIFYMLIHIGMILLDIVLQCLLFIAMIDLSKTCDTIASLICYALVMFMIYPWIKIKLKVLFFNNPKTLL
jgi:ABC-type transport system involved in Fe-S cluster assembly fused permease/ATPase subunit